MNDWTDEAAWIVMPDGTPKIHPKTRIELLDDGGVRLHAHRVTGFAVTLDSEHALAKAALARLAVPE